MAAPTFRGVLAGSLVLIALEVTTSSDKAAGRVGSMLSGVAGLVRRFLDPTVPAIPDLTGGTADQTSTTPTTSTVDDDEPAPRLPNVAAV